MITFIKRLFGYKENKFVDWTPILECIPDKHSKTILELGIGDGTQHLLESFDSVYSFEIAESKDWYCRCEKKIKSGEWIKKRSWKGFYYTLSEMGLDEMEKQLLSSEGKQRHHISI